jgi:signal recognition particle GTPase
MVLYSSKLQEPVQIQNQPGDPIPPTKRRKTKTKNLEPPAAAPLEGSEIKVEELGSEVNGVGSQVIQKKPKTEKQLAAIEKARETRERKKREDEENKQRIEEELERTKKELETKKELLKEKRKKQKEEKEIENNVSRALIDEGVEAPKWVSIPITLGKIIC